MQEETKRRLSAYLTGIFVGILWGWGLCTVVYVPRIQKVRDAWRDTAEKSIKDTDECIEMIHKLATSH